jgi:general secretion pathway protein E
MDPLTAQTHESAQLALLRHLEAKDFLTGGARLLETDTGTAGSRLASMAGIEWFESREAPVLSLRTDLVSLFECRRRFCAIAQDGEQLLGLVAQPFDIATRTYLQSVVLPARLPLALIAPARLNELLDQAGPLAGESAVSPVAGLDSDDGDFIELALGNNDGALSAVSIIDRLFTAALREGGSDIHVETTQSGLAMRVRVDGLLEPPQLVKGRALAEQVLSRLKVLGNLDIAERRRPQDGRFRIRHAGRMIDVRLSVMPSIHGEDAVVRLLDKSSLVVGDKLTLDALGFDPTGLDRLRKLASLPYGMLLVTGPTGSGKTTTLYGVLSEIDSGRDKIITIEDPVEYQVPGILQVPVNEKKGLTFAVGLRSILRHDPDRIMVGEIRDTETADIAVQAALTGHLVLTTVHANNVFDVLGRFSHMGIDPYTFVSALNGVWAQRLLRRVCSGCAEPCAAPIDVPEVGESSWMRASGCAACRNTGYRGRLAIAESLVMDDDLRQRIIERQPIASLREAARQRGTQPLREAALRAAARGITTIDEVRRVTREDL